MPDLSRRAFLAVFAAAAVGHVVGDYNPERLTWLAPAGVKTFPAPGEMIRDQIRRIERAMPAADLSLQQLTRDILQQTWRELGQPTDLVRVRGGRMGDTVAIPEVRVFVVGPYDESPLRINYRTALLTDQFHVALSLYPQRLLELYGREDVPAHVRREYVEKAGRLMAREIERRKLTVFGDDLALPMGCGFGEMVSEGCRLTDDTSGLTLRGLRVEYWDHPLQAWISETRFDFLGGRG